MNIFLIAVILGIVQGMTEFIPVSSTGHLILTGHLLGFEDEKAKTFEVIIQLGSILAVVFIYFERILYLLKIKKSPGPILQKGREDENAKEGDLRSGTPAAGLDVFHIGAAMAPAVIVGLLFHKAIKTYLFSPKTVLIGLVVGGLFLIFSEKKQPGVTAENLDRITYFQAMKIGFFQCFALWPGFSRSGATIAGGLLCGLNHKTAADFSFLVAIPMMFAAGGLDLVKSYKFLSMDDFGFFAVGFIVSFFVAMLAIKFFLKFLERWKLSPFAYYRFSVAFFYFWFILR